MEIRLGRVPLAVLMRTPGNEEALVLGFAITEGIVLGPAEVAGVRDEGDGDRFSLVLADGVIVDPEQFRRNTYTTSSCGVCGKASIDAVRIASPPLARWARSLSIELILSLPDRLTSRPACLRRHRRPPRRCHLRSPSGTAPGSRRRRGPSQRHRQSHRLARPRPAGRWAT